jgi:hypothetical protein
VALDGLFACCIGILLNWLPARRLLSVCLGRWAFFDFLPARAWLSVCLRRWAFLELVAYAALLGCTPAALALFSYWFISVAPVRGGHLLFFACRVTIQRL